MTRKPAVVLLVLSLAVLALALVPAPGLAAKGGAAGKPGGGGGGGKPGGGGGGTCTISVVLLNSTDGVPHYGQQVTFAVSTTATRYPYVTLKCSRAGGLVYEASKGIFPTSLRQTFTLGPTGNFTGGDADSTATLQNWDSYSKNGSITALASTTFHVYA